MGTALRVITLFIILIVIGAGVAGIALFVVSDGNPVSYIQTELIRLSLASRQDELNRAIGTDETPQRFTINSGDSPSLVAQNLFTQNLITDAELFVDYLRVEALDTQLEAGTYFLNQTQNIPDIAYTLIDSRNSSITFRVFEGSRIEEVAATIEANRLFGFTGQEFLLLAQQGFVDLPEFAARYGIPGTATLEGYLYPDTYILPPSITAVGLRETLLEAFSNAVDGQLLADANAQGWSMHEIVTLASIVEREAVWNEENPTIASVYRNRLEIGQTLDADPTVQYGLQNSRGTWWPNITQADYRNVQSPYNTYINNGLPPGPIASPSLAAIRGALYPAQTDYFYFQAQCDGTGYHNFTQTYEQHLQNSC